MYGCFICMYIYAAHMCCDLRGQKTASELLECTDGYEQSSGAGNQTPVFSKSRVLFTAEPSFQSQVKKKKKKVNSIIS